MIIAGTLKLSWSGFVILSMESVRRLNPTNIIMKETANEEIYSKRPCPKGWSLSGRLLLIFAPSILTSDEPVSERLLKASDVIAMLPIREPMKSFSPNRKRLQIIPRIPPRTPYRSLTSRLLVSV